VCSLSGESFQSKRVGWLSALVVSVILLALPFFLAVAAAAEGPSFLFRLTQHMYMADVGVVSVVGLRGFRDGMEISPHVCFSAL
jgi:hypothetical protein